jgi:hypothetical protein
VSGEHERAGELLPWMANGSLAGADLAWLQQHLEGCERCRAELEAHRLMRDALSRQPTVEYAPQPAFNRLWARIEADAALPVAAQPSALPPGPVAPRRFWRWMAAGVAAQLLVATVLGATLWHNRIAAPPASYVTVTAEPAVPVARLKVVFDDAVTLRDLKDIFVRIGLVPVGGPSPAGVMTLAADPLHAAADDATLLTSLRADPRVRFAELVAR